MNIVIRTGVPTEDNRDFLNTLAKMYIKSSFYNGFYLKKSADEVSIHCKSCNFENEVGVHRLVRISPFDKQHRRITCFNIVEIDGVSRKDMVCSYVLHPFTMAKNYFVEGSETEDVEYVLSGHPLALLPS